MSVVDEEGNTAEPFATALSHHEIVALIHSHGGHVSSCATETTDRTLGVADHGEAQRMPYYAPAEGS